MTKLSGSRDVHGGRASHGEQPGGPTVGKYTLVEPSSILGGAVQRRVDEHVASDPASVHAAAAHGIATPASPLPHGATLQQLFGRHDLSSVQAHVGPDAAASARAMGADAYATGHHVVLGGSTDLFTVAHEAAHVVQQRAGVHLKGGVGEVGDAYERQADAVAAQVVRGESAEALLGEPSPGSAAAAVQRSPGTGAVPASEATGAAPASGAATAGEPSTEDQMDAKEGAPPGARNRDREDGDGAAPAAAPVQQRVLITTPRGTRIRISDRRARDYGDRGRVLRRSEAQGRRNYLVVEFDNEPRVGYRVHIDDMDYEQRERSRSPRREQVRKEPRPDSSASDRLWLDTGQGSAAWQNCAHFATQNEFLGAEQRVDRIAASAHTAGLRVTRSQAEATVVFYGSGTNYSHAIRKVSGHWEEVQYPAGPHRQYTGLEDPPPLNRGDRIVLMMCPM
jgi:hypothetical protein